MSRPLKNRQRGFTATLSKQINCHYAVLRRMAYCQFAHEAAGHTLQPTAVLHEAFLRLANQRLRSRSKPFFIYAATRNIHQFLIDYARRRSAEIRDARRRVSIDGVDVALPDALEFHVRLSEAMERLATQSPRRAAVASMIASFGFSIKEAAATLSITPATASKEWRAAQSWLQQQMGRV